MKTNAFVGFPRLFLNWPFRPITHGILLCAWGALMCARAASPHIVIGLLPDGEAVLSVSGDTNRFELIEISSNLTVWTPLVTLLNSNGTVNYVDATTTNSSVRFYRAQRRITTNGPSFNTALLFNLTMEDAANPSCGCAGESAYNQGISQVSSGCPECESAAPVAGMAQDTGGGQVFLHNGEFVHRALDLEISSRGFNWRLERVYRSGITFDGPLGHNWDFAHNRRLLVETNGHLLRMDGDGRADRYVSVDGTNYQSPRGFYTKLIRQPGGSFVERDRHGTKVLYAAPDERGIAVMTEVRDRHTNAMHFEYNSAAQLVRVRDTFGRAIDYRYSLAGRLSEVEDFTGRIITYQYDSLGNLISVTSPAVTGTPHGNDFPAGKTTRYEYSSSFADERLNHNLVSITAPNEAAVSGPARVGVEYETNTTADLDRLVRLHLGGTNASAVPAGGTLTYAYQNLGAAASNDFLTAVFETAVTDRNGNLAEYQFNQLGNAVRVREFSNRDVRPGDPAFFETRYEYNGEGEMTRLVRPEGNSVEFTYDTASSDRFQQGNLLLTRRLPDVARGGDQTNIVKSFTYEPLFNQVRTITHPRGNDAGYVPQNGGAQSAARYTATLSYDYQESASEPGEASAFGITVPPALLGLGDLNDDGQTNQNGGTLIRRDDPTVTLLAGSNQALAEGDTTQEIVTRSSYNQFGQMIRMENARGNITTFFYFPENDPDGDGLNLIPGADPTTGGYLAQMVRDGVLGARRQDGAALVAITNRITVDARGNITAFTDGRGLTRRTTYNALDQVVQEEAPPVDGSQPTGYLRRYLYDANNNRVGTDVQNVTTDVSTHLPVIVAGHPWFQHRMTFDILNQIVESVSDTTRDSMLPPSTQPQSLTNQFRYDANQNGVRTLSPLAANGGDANNDERTIYDERDLRFTVTRGGVSAGASTQTYDYDLNGNAARWTDAEDNDGVAGNEFETITYDGFDRVRITLDRGGNAGQKTYDPDGRVVREDFLGSADGVAATNVLLRRKFSLFDEAGRLIQKDRALFLATGVTQQVVTSLVDGPLTPGDGRVSERHEFDASGRMTFRGEDDNAVYRYEYDGADRRIREVLPLVDTVTTGGPFPTQVEMEYDRNGNVVRRIETHTSPQGLMPPAVLTDLYVYDALNRRVRATDPLGLTSYMEYDSRDNIVATYDARAALIADPLGLYTAGNINARGNTTRYAYDGMSRLWREEKEITTTGEGGAPLLTANPFNNDGRVTLLMEHDANSRLVSGTDDTTNRTRYAYDSLNRLVAQTNADGGFRIWQYDRDNHRTGLRDENNTLHTLGYDALDRRVTHQLAPDLAKTNSAGLPLLIGTTLQTFQYDGLSRLVQCTDNNDPADTNDDWTVEMKHDSLNRLVEEVQNGRAVSSGYVADDRTDLHYPGAGRVVHFTYDPHDQLVGVSNNVEFGASIGLLGNCCAPIQYSLAGPPAPTPTLVVNQTLNANRLVTQIQQTSSTLGQIGGHFFQRNRNNDVVSQGRLARSATQQLNENLGITMDSLDRQAVFSAQINGPGLNTNYVRAQAINGAQDVREVRSQFNQTIQQLLPSPTHEPQSGPLQHNGSPSPSPGTGVRTRDTNFIYQWDGLDRLRAVRERTNPSNIVASFNYDASPAMHNGRRVQQILAGGTTRFYYDDAHCIEETYPIIALPERVTRQYIYGSQPDEVLAMDADTNNDGNPDQLSFYLRDHNNNVTQLVDTNGVPVEFYFYDYRGRPAIYDAATLQPRTNSLRGNPWMFTGQRYDDTIELYYYKARFYDPVYGVFLSRDPVGAWHDAANLGNGMAYAGLASLNRSDSSGLKTFCFFYLSDDTQKQAERLAEANHIPDMAIGLAIPVNKSGSTLKTAFAGTKQKCCDEIQLLGHGYPEGGIITPDGDCGIDDAKARKGLTALAADMKAILCNPDKDQVQITLRTCWGAKVSQFLADAVGTQVTGITGTCVSDKTGADGKVQPIPPIPNDKEGSKWETAKPLQKMVHRLPVTGKQKVR